MVNVKKVLYVSLLFEFCSNWVGTVGRASWTSADGVLHTFKVAGTASEIDDKAVEAFVDEDDFIISLDYNDKMGVCSIVLETSSWQMVSEVNGLLFYFAKLEDIIYKLYWLCIFYRSSLLVMSTRRMQYLFLCNDSWL